MADDEARLDYGFSSGFLNANPDIRRLVDQAIDEGWTQTRFSDELKQTNWWSKRSDAQRRYDLMKVENPAEIDRQESEARGTIRRLAQRLGVRLDGEKVSALARRWVRNDLSEEEMRSLVGREYETSSRPDAYNRENLGMAGQARHQLAAMAREYGFSLSLDRLNEMTRQVVRGTRQVEDYTGFFRERAESLFPSIQADLREGRTVREVLDPYLNIAAEELGINPRTMNTTASKWLKPLQHTPKGESGARRMTNEEWVQELRTNTRYGFDESNNAQRQGAELARALGERMGRF